jgi:hypothetical protein
VSARTSTASPRAAPVLVTGAHRSGTTWVGTTLAANEHIFYLPEPFNLDHLYPGLCGARFPCWFMRIDADNEEMYRDDIARMLRLEFCWRDAVAATARSPKASVRAVRIARALRRARGGGCRPLVKDPIALLSAEWLADTFGTQVIVLIRHPAAFTASLLRLDWRFDLANFASQPALLDHDLAPFAAEIEAAAGHRLDAVAEAGLLWRCLYATVDRYRRERPDWLFLRHEDLSARPVDGFQAMCRHLGIAYSPAIANEVSRTTSPGNPVDAPPGVAHALLRDSRRAAANWRPRMDPADIAALRSSVEDVSSSFYTDAEWPE